MPKRSSAGTVVFWTGILLAVLQVVGCWGGRSDDPIDTTKLQATFLPAPGVLKATLLADRSIAVSWINNAFYTTVFVTRTDDTSQSIVCSPPTAAGFQVGSGGNCIVPSPIGAATADTTILFDVEGCDAQVTGLCSPRDLPGV